MTTLRIDLDDELVALLGDSGQPAATAAREMIVLELYRRGTLSGGRAAALLGLGLGDFLRLAGRVGIARFDMTAEEWDVERERSESL